MAQTTWREGSSRVGIASGSDFTSSGTNYEPTFQIVKLNGSNQVVASAASTDKHIGVIMNCPTSGDTADVLLINNMGTGKVQAGGTVNVGDDLTSDASGHAVATTTSGDIIIGQAIQAGASGQTVEYISFRGKI
jgi:hypothetical protein